jgi:hypothetical protein
MGPERGVASWRVFTAKFLELCGMVKEEVGLTLASLFLLSQIVPDSTPFVLHHSTGERWTRCCSHMR